MGYWMWVSVGILFAGGIGGLVSWIYTKGWQDGYEAGEKLWRDR